MTTTRKSLPSLTRAIDIWENEGGALRLGHVQRQFGRRIEANRRWTVYHVFSGVPASQGSRTLTGMSRSEATSRMISLNANCAGLVVPSACTDSGSPTI